MMVPFGVKEFDNNGKKSYQMCLSFGALTNLYNEEEIKKFYLFIQKIDTVNEETVTEYKKSWGLPADLKYKKTLQRLSKDYPHYMNINLPHDKNLGFLFHIYDETATKSTIDIIEKRSIVSVVMELTDLKFTDKEFRANWTVMQIRKFKPYSPIQEFFMTGCFICDEDDPEDTAHAKIIEKYRASLQTPIQLPNIPQLNPYYTQQPIPPHPNYYQYPPHPAPSYQHPGSYQQQALYERPLAPPQPIPQQRPGGAFAPTALELENAMKKLKKTTVKMDDAVPIPPPPPPPPVDTNNQLSIETKTESKKNNKDKTDKKIIKDLPKKDSKSSKELAKKIIKTESPDKTTKYLPKKIVKKELPVKPAKQDKKVVKKLVKKIIKKEPPKKELPKRKLSSSSESSSDESEEVPKKKK